MTSESNYGVLLEYLKPEHLIEAAKRARAAGFRMMDGFTPFPIEELADAIGFNKNRVPLIALIGGVLGGASAFGMQWYANVLDYPISVGGRPDFSWQAFVPVTFELTILGAALSAAFGMIFLNRLPRLWHPVFESERFRHASRDRFYLCIKASDPFYSSDSIQALFQNSGAIHMEELKVEE